MFSFLVSFLTLPSSSHSKASFNFHKIYISESHATLQWIPTLLNPEYIRHFVIFRFFWKLPLGPCSVILCPGETEVCFVHRTRTWWESGFLPRSQSVSCLPPQFIRAPWRSVVGKQNGSSLEKVISLVELKQNTKIVAIFIREYILCLLNANCVRDCPGPIYIPALLPAKGNLIN